MKLINSVIALGITCSMLAVGSTVLAGHCGGVNCYKGETSEIASDSATKSSTMSSEGGSVEKGAE